MQPSTSHLASRIKLIPTFLMSNVHFDLSPLFSVRNTVLAFCSFYLQPRPFSFSDRSFAVALHVVRASLFFIPFWILMHHLWQALLFSEGGLRPRVKYLCASVQQYGGLICSGDVAGIVVRKVVLNFVRRSFWVNWFWAEMCPAGAGDARKVIKWFQPKHTILRNALSRVTRQKLLF